MENVYRGREWYQLNIRIRQVHMYLRHWQEDNLPAPAIHHIRHKEADKARGLAGILVLNGILQE